MFHTLFTRFSQAVDVVNDVTGKLIAWLTLVMVLATCAVVIARYFFGVGSIGLQESVMYLHGIVFMFGIAFTLKEQGHVRVDVLNEKLSERTRTLIDLAGHILFLVPLAVFIIYMSYDYVLLSWSVKETSNQPGGLPFVYWLKTIIPIMGGLLLLQGLSEIIKSIQALKDGQWK